MKPITTSHSDAPRPSPVAYSRSSSARSLTVIGRFTISLACENPGHVFRTAPGDTLSCATGHIWVRNPALYYLWNSYVIGTHRRSLLMTTRTGWIECTCHKVDVFLQRDPNYPFR